MDYTTEDTKDELKISGIKTGIDGDLIDNLHPSLINKSHIAGFVGKSKSGKSNLMVNLLSKGKKNGVRQSYKKVFHDVIVVSPSLKSFKNNIFEDVDDDKKFETLDYNSLEFIDTFTEMNTDLQKNTLVVLDDVGSSLKEWSNYIALQTQKYRHRRTTWFIIVQKYKDLPTSIRANLTALYLFRPISQMELESVWQELLPFNKKNLIPFINWVFDTKYNFLFVDMSLEKSASPIYYKNFRKIIFNKNNNETTLI